MDDFYANNVHCFINTDIDASLQKYRRRITSSMSWMGLTLSDLKDMIIFDMGTGYHAIVFAEMGCKRIYHVDISQSQVAWLKEYSQKNGITSIETTCHDVMKSIGDAQDIDLIFLVGVYHHLSCPPKLLLQLMERSHIGAKFFIRCYRSGTWSRWLVSHLRRISSLLCPSDIQRAVAAIYPLENDGQFLGDIIDDLFVPVWGCYHPEQFSIDANVMGMDFRTDSKYFIYDHGDYDENFRAEINVISAHKNSSVNPYELATAFPISQIDLGCENILIEKNNMLLNEFSYMAEYMEPFGLACKIVTLYRLGRKLKQMDYLSLTYLKNNAERIDNLAEYRHACLSNIINQWRKNN